MEWVAEKAKALTERGYKCENCGKQTEELEFHHALIRRRKNYPCVNTRLNGALLCKSCHDSGIVDSWEWRCEFYTKQANRYGLRLTAWIDSLPDKLRYRIDFVS